MSRRKKFRTYIILTKDGGWDGLIPSWYIPHPDPDRQRKLSSPVIFLTFWLLLLLLLLYFFSHFHRRNDLVNLVRMMMPSRIPLPLVYRHHINKYAHKMVYFISLKRIHSWTSCRQYFISYIFFPLLYFFSFLCSLILSCFSFYFFTLNFICPLRCSRLEHSHTTAMYWNRVFSLCWLFTTKMLMVMIIIAFILFLHASLPMAL